MISSSLGTVLRRWSQTIWVWALLNSAPCFATPPVISFHIAAQPLSSALIEFSHTAGVDFIAPSYLLSGLNAPAVEAEVTAETALTLLLQETGLVYSRKENGTFIIKKIRSQKPLVQQSTIEEIIVTAQKRDQLAQDVPIAMSVVTGEQLIKMGKSDIRDLFELAPSVAYYGAISSAGQALRIRGIGSGVIASGIEQSAGTVIDGVVTGPSGSGLEELWDVERIEVLRGPQGTLFGKNVSAGAINQITNSPSEDFAAQWRSRYEFEHQAVRTDAFLNGNIRGHLDGRLAAFYLDQQLGGINNHVRNETENRKHRWGIRGKLHYRGDTWWSKLNLAFDAIDDSCCARTFAKVDNHLISDFTRTWVLNALAQNAITPSDHNRQAINESPLSEQAKTWHGVLEMGKNLASGHTLKWLSGYRYWHHESFNDADNIDSNIVTVADDRTLELYTQEVQWLSPSNRDFVYVLGAYYYDQRFPSVEYIGGGADLVGTNGTTNVDSEIHIYNSALYGHATYTIADQWEAFAGYRYLHETLTGSGRQYGDNWIWPTDYNRNSVNTTDSDTLGSVGLQFYFNNSQQLYVSVARGYKGQAIDNTSNSVFFRAPLRLENGTTLTADDAILRPEIVVNYELGSKNIVLNHHLILNATVFHSVFRDFQISAYDGNTHSFRLINAGSVLSRGLEVEFQAQPWDKAQLSGSLTWTDARFKDYKGAPCQVQQIAAGTCSAATGGQDLSGKAINGTPDWQVFLRYQQNYTTALGEGYFDISYSWRDGVIFDGDLDPNTYQAAFGLWHIRTGLQMSENWEASVFINNLFNQGYAVRIIDAPIWTGTYQRYPGDLRTLGLDVSYRWH